MSGVEMTFDPAKREATLRERGLDFLDAPKVLDGRSITVVDDRFDYGEVRYVTYGWMEEVAVAMVWMKRDEVHRVISMRRMHAEDVRYVGLD